jgi:xanthine dehydrogenase accessory factor
MTGEIFERLRRAIAEQERCVLFTVVDGDAAGAKLLAFESGETLGNAPAELAERAPQLLREARNQPLELADGTRVLSEFFGPPPRLVVYGAVDLAEALCRVARVLGWTSIVADARSRFATRERIPSADELIVEWPEDALAQIAPDAWTAVVVLTHDDKFDVPALKAALASEAFYIGALGSRRNQERRRERLLEAGVPEDDLERISGPCGLDVGADTQPETAISIVGEILAVRAKRDGGRLQQAKQRIHVEQV